MTQSSPDARSGEPVSEHGSPEAYPNADPGLEIYENGEQVGILDLDAESSVYDGSYELIAELLERIENDGYTIWAARTTDVTGIGLGRQLLRRLHERAATDQSSDANLELGTTGFEPEFDGYLDGSAFAEMHDVMGELAQKRAERDGDS